MLNLRDQAELSQNFRGAIDADGHPTGKYKPEIMIERNWGLTDRQSHEYFQYDGQSPYTLDPTEFTSIDEMSTEFKKIIRADLSRLIALYNDEDIDIVRPPFGIATSLRYHLWVNNDNRDCAEQLRFPVVEIDTFDLEDAVETQNISKILDTSLVFEDNLAVILGVCRPWLKPAFPDQPQQLRLF